MGKNIFLVALLFLSFAIQKGFSQPDINSCDKISNFIDKMNLYHLQSPQYNDDFSASVYTNFLKSLDSRGFIFLKQDLELFSSFKNNIDNELLSKKCAFFNLVLEKYKVRIHEVDSIFDFSLSKSYNFDNPSVYTSIKDSLISPATNKERQERIESWIKVIYLDELFNDIDSVEKVDISELKLKVANYKNNVENRAKQISSPENDYNSYVLGAFLNSIAQAYDPHSSYFSENEFDDFKEILSREINTFGFNVDLSSAGQIVISELIPGAPAWRSNKIHRGDILLKLKWEKASFDASKSTLRETRKLLKKIESTQIVLTIKDQTGQVSEVELRKEKIVNDENTVRSFVLAGNKKIGYISLPDFYTEWDKSQALGCANDVAKEIVKLKKENIDALILDLRDNGGGSVYEAINLAGIFINEGPLSVVKYKGVDRPTVIKDINRGTVYDGPLAIMVNGRSASASEFVAAALQDYKRALIVGANSYGKATMQVVLPLDSAAFLKKSEARPVDYLKVTMGVLYRINSESVQQKGVVPDITIPDVFEKFPISESLNKSAIIAAPLSKKFLYTPCSTCFNDVIKEKSMKRILNDASFKKIFQYQDTLLRYYNKRTFETSFTRYKSDLVNTAKMWGVIGKITQRETILFKVENNLTDKQWINIDVTKDEINNEIKEDISTDIYIQETYNILNDIINK